MSDSTPFILNILVADGDPDGLRVVERSNWNGKALIFPRVVYPKIRRRDEFKRPGVYLLLGPHPENDGDTLYIGEGDPVFDRFESHYANKDFWTKAVFFVAGLGQLNKAHVQYLESQLVARAKAAKQTPLENGNTPSEPTLSEADKANMDVFLQNLLGILPVLNIHAFEQIGSVIAKDRYPMLFCQARDTDARGQDTPQGFVVLSGSLARIEEVPSLQQHFPSICKMRADLVKNGVLVMAGKNYRFTQDYTFSSPSLAASFVMARSANGRIDWRDANGKTLKEMQEEQAKK